MEGKNNLARTEVWTWASPHSLAQRVCHLHAGTSVAVYIGSNGGFSQCKLSIRNRNPKFAIMSDSVNTERANRSLLEMVNEAQHRLQHMEISCQQILPSTGYTSPQSVHDPLSNDPKVLQVQVAQLRTQLLTAVTLREKEDVNFRQAAQYAAAKGTANGVLHALFDQASAGKTEVLKMYLDTGSIPTRDGLRHWRLDLCSIRNETGASLLHVAVGVSTAKQSVKIKLVNMLLDRVGFDPTVRDVYGQTPLHVAAMSGYSEVVDTLLERGADPLAQDRSGLTALSLVRTLSRPPEEVVQKLLKAEKVTIQNMMQESISIPLSKALMSAVFLQGLSRFALKQHSNAFAHQTTTLVHALLEESHDGSIEFDRVIQKRVPMLFDVVPATQVVRLKSIFLRTMFKDPNFIDELKIEANGYGLSLVTPASAVGSLTGPTWTSVLLKLIQGVQLEMAGWTQNDIHFDDVPAHVDRNVIMKDSIDNVTSPPSRKWSTSSSFTSTDTDSCSALRYADQTSFVAQTRAVWYYAVLFKASTSAFPGTLTVTPGSTIAVASEDVSKYFPLDDRLTIGSAEYFAVSYDSKSRAIRLDRGYDGRAPATLTAYLSGSSPSGPPPNIAVKRIWEREPGNKYEDQMSSEQELFQDYQFLDPESEYEVAIKLGPIPSGQDARGIVAEWKRTAKELFDSRKCISEMPCCQYYCSQRSGHSLCLGTLAAIGQGLAKRRLGRITFSKPSKPRASLQRLQDRFKGTEAWPGSPSKSATTNPP
ncbi:putative ankyrin repeat and death domain-containing protein 1A/1B [Plasmopara halstedii]